MIKFNHISNLIRLFYIILLFIVISTNNTYLFFSNSIQLTFILWANLETCELIEKNIFNFKNILEDNSLFKVLENDSLVKIV